MSRNDVLSLEERQRLIETEVEKLEAKGYQVIRDERTATVMRGPAGDIVTVSVDRLGQITAVDRRRIGGTLIPHDWSPALRVTVVTAAIVTLLLLGVLWAAITA